MKNRKFLLLNTGILLFALAILIPTLSPKTSGVFAQQGNTITGQIMGFEREPLYDVYVELLNDYSQSIKRTRTDSSGTYFFYGLAAGRYSVRVMPFGTDYEEQVQSVEIANLPFSRGDNPQTGQTGQSSGFTIELLDFNLRLKKGLTPQTSGALFVQEIPENAKKLYQKAISDLGNKKEKEGLAGLISAIEAFPKYFAALERLGYEYVRLKQYEAAQILFNNALAVNPRSYRSWYGLAYSSYLLNKFDEAAAAVSKALEFYQGSPDAFLLSGILKRRNKKFDEAEKDLLKAKELARESKPMIHWHLALLYGNDMKRYGDAAKELKLFLKAEPNAQDKEKIEALIKEFEEKAKTEKNK